MWAPGGGRESVLERGTISLQAEVLMVTTREHILCLLHVACVLLLGISATAQLETRSKLPADFYPNSVVTADFNRDGKVDLAVSLFGGTAEVDVFLGKGDGTFGPPTAYDIGVGTGPLAVGDLNHDGIPDLVVVNDNDTVSVLLGNGDGTFQSVINYATPAGPAYIALGDFNNDGNLDIVTSDQYDNPCYCVSVLLGNGDGTFQEPAITTDVPGFPLALTVGYFDADKNLDIALAGGFVSSGAIQILLGNGDGTFRLGASYDLAPEPESIVAADFRNNGKTDLAVGEFGGRGVAVLLGNGDGTFEQPVVYDITTPLGVATADFNGDGILDMVASSPGVNKGFTGVFLGNGDGTFKNAKLYPTGQFPWGVAVADFNGDHMADLTVADEGTATEYVLLNTGVVDFSPTTEVTFKKQKHGTTSPPQTVTLTNTGKSTLKISSMKATGQFAMTTTCKANVAPGASCTIKVTFSPQTQGVKSGTVSINDSASKKPQVIALSGDGT
jgi:hypothetical protein